MAVGQLPAKLTQNTLDFWAKQIQEFVDAYYGSDNDNKETPIYLPFSIDCYTPYTTQSLFSGGNGYLHGVVHFVIPIGNTDNYIKEVIPSEPWASAQDQTVINQYALTYLNKNDAFIDNEIYMQRAGGTNTLFTTLDNNNLTQIFTHDGFYRNPNLGDGAPLVQFEKLTTIYFDRSATGFNWTKGSSQNNVAIKPVADYMTITGGGTSDYNSVINEVYNNSEYNNTYNYTTDNGDTVTTYYGDNYINYSYDGIHLSYDDIYDITNHVLTDLITHLGDDWNGDETPIYFPTYDEIKYVDMGDFYITPIHQYDKLPAAPQIDQTIDFGEYPAILAETSTAFFNMLPVTLSALLAATLVIAVLIRNIGR